MLIASHGCGPRTSPAPTVIAASSSIVSTRVGEEVARAWVLRRGEERRRLVVLDGLAGFHVEDEVGEAVDEADRVGDDDHRVAALDEAAQGRAQLRGAA